MCGKPDLHPLERLLPGIVRLVVQHRMLTDDAAEMLLIAADIAPDADLIQELTLWAAILRESLAAGGSDAGILAAEGLRLRGVRDESMEEVFRILGTGVGL